MGHLRTGRGSNRRPEVEETQPHASGNIEVELLKKERPRSVSVKYRVQTTPIPVPAYALARSSELALKMSYLRRFNFSEPEVQTTELVREAPLQESKGRWSG